MMSRLDETEKLERLEEQRTKKRERLESLFKQKVEIEDEMKKLTRDLEELDNVIDAMENDEPGATVKAEAVEISDDGAATTSFQETLDPGATHVAPVISSLLTTQGPDEFLTDPLSSTYLTAQTQREVQHNDDWDGNDLREAYEQSMQSLGHEARDVATRPLLVGGTLDSYFGVSAPAGTGQPLDDQDTMNPPSHNPPFQPIHNQHAPQRSVVAKPNEPRRQFPWSHQMKALLHNTFRIPSFRDQQEDIINATLAGEDVFVIMRTGGGKSLTYQLPALLEGRSSSKKVTFVISPLLSLIQDQEEQMNEFAAGSALSFTSALGGSAEHARRWGLVRDSTAGICLVFVTPEKVSKSNKLCAELDKLYAQQRLGRFVIDEAHCACQWGHDFRPDYALLGKLKSHFPSIPVIAVTATASDRVREDVCNILRLVPSKTRFFRSTAHRPNLTYSIRTKADGAANVITEMATFIKEHHAQNAGIVYTYSRKDADSVADALCDHGVIAEAYHSDVSVARKDMIHRSWMRNETQVVVATIAFGLGINKPDVRFVLHHSISKTLEAYYQESGRAGRDGNPAECVLYYSPKDVIRLLKMVHGTSSEHLLWPMIRYAQQSGNDAICKAIILMHLGEPNAPDVRQIVQENDGVSSNPRDVGVHAQTVVKLLGLRMREGKDMTLAMLVKEWRGTSSAPQFVKDNPPAKDGLSVEDCERIVISLLLEKVLATNPIWNAYNTVIYFVLGELGNRMEQSPNPRFVIRFPKPATPQSKPTKAAVQSKSRKSVATEGTWLTTKSKATKRKKATAARSKAPTKARATKTKATRTTKKPKAKPKRSEVIELSSDDEDTKPAASRLSETEQDESFDESESEAEFE